MTIAMGCGGGALDHSARVADGSEETTTASIVFDASSDEGHLLAETGGQGVDGPDSGAMLTGRVVSWYTLRPLGGRGIFIGNQRTASDANGRFSLRGVAGVYDALVVDPDGTVVSVYRGLSRRDPVLVHPGTPLLTHAAGVSGDVSGGDNYPLPNSDGVLVNYFSQEADQFWLLGQGLPTLQRGPAYGPIPLRWDGPASISGELVAFGLFRDPDGGRSSWFVHKPLTLTDGQMAFANLALTLVSRTRHISGNIALPADTQIVQKAAFYRLPIVNATVDVPVSQSGAFDDDLPDLSEPGTELCVSATARPGSAFTSQCGVSLNQTGFTLTIQAPPSMSSPPPDSMVAKDTVFSWTSFDSGMYLLELVAVPSSAVTPRIYLFTSETSTVWPDLGGVDVAFPVGATYECAIGGLGPFGSMDDAFGLGGLGAPFPAEMRRSFSTTLNVTTRQ